MTTPHSSHRSTRARRVLLAYLTAIATVVVIFAAPATPVQAASPSNIAAGLDHSCALLDTGRVQCWGLNTSGQLGVGAASPGSVAPLDVVDLTNVVAVAAGGDVSCAIRVDRTLWCWGAGFMIPDNGTNDQVAPDQVEGIGPVARVEISTSHLCIVEVDGGVRCWGDNSTGQLGIPTAGGDRIFDPIAGLPPIVDITVAAFKTCAADNTGAVWCWGSTFSGAWGVPSGNYDTPQLTPLTGATQVAMGDTNLCLLSSSGSVTCHGKPERFNGNDPSTDGVAVAGLDDVVQITSSGAATCVVRSNAVLSCWGVGPAKGSADALLSTPTDIATGVTGASMGLAHLCFTTSAGGAFCQGRNRAGEVGIDIPGIISRPRVVSDVEATDISLGFLHTCASTVDETLVCWGDNTFGQSGGTSFGVPTPPTEIASVGKATSATAGTYVSCGLNTGGVSCLDRGAFTSLATLGDPPKAITDLEIARATGTGGSPPDHRCAISDGATWCWGLNENGELGDGTTQNTTIPVEVQYSAGTPAVIDVAIDSRTSCSLHVDGSLRCWGSNSTGQLGDGTTTQRELPVEVVGLPAGETVVAFDHNAAATCAVMSNHTVWCWGGTSGGRLGPDGQNSVPNPDPLLIPTDAEALSVTVGGDFACLIDANEEVWCWGNKQAGSLGDGDVPLVGDQNDRTRLTPGATGYEADQLAASEQTICGRKGTVVSCWGQNSLSQTGQDNVAVDAVPIPLSGSVAATTTTTTTTTTTLPDTATTTVPDTTTTTTVPDATTTTVPVVPPASPDLFSPVAPARLVDTRTTPSAMTIDGEQLGDGQLNAAGSITVDIAGRAGVPDNAATAVINITAIRPAAVGYITGHPCLDPAPTTSSLNYSPGVSLGNEIIVELDTNGNACLFTSAPTDIAVDIVAYLPTGATYTAVGPARLADTRQAPAGTTIDGNFVGDGALTPGDTYEIDITGRANIPTGTSAAVVNVTAIRAAGVGYFTVHPCLPTEPNAASLNYTAGANRGNEIIAPLSPDGTICVFSSTTTDLAVDVVGYITDTAYTPVTPARLLETRTGPTLTTADGQFEGQGKREADSSLAVDIAGRVDIPDNAQTVTINITAINAEAVGYVTVHPCLDTPPNAASLNYTPGVNGGNEIIAQLDPNGRACIYTSAPVHLTIDIAGHTT